MLTNEVTNVELVRRLLFNITTGDIEVDGQKLSSEIRQQIFGMKNPYNALPTAVPKAALLAVPKAASLAVPKSASLAVPKSASLAVPKAASFAVPKATSDAWKYKGPVTLHDVSTKAEIDKAIYRKLNDSRGFTGEEGDDSRVITGEEGDDSMGITGEEGYDQMEIHNYSEEGDAAPKAASFVASKANPFDPFAPSFSASKANPFNPFAASKRKGGKSKKSRKSKKSKKSRKSKKRW